MINTIERSYYPDKGLSNVEQLTGYTFSSESYAHTFIIRQFEKSSDGVYTQTDFDSSVAIQLHFLAADGVTQVVNGAVENGAAVVTLPPECYTVTGRFGIVIMAISGSTKYVIYAAAAYCYASNSDVINISDGSVSEMQAKMDQIAQLQDAAHWVAIFARNIGDIEGRYDAATTQMEQDISAATTAMQTTVDTAITGMETLVTEAVNDYYDVIDQQNEAIDQQSAAVNEAIGNWESMVTALRNAVEEADLKVLNTPNLIKPNDVWELNGSEQIVYGQTRKWYASNMPYVKNALGKNSETAGVDPDEVTVTALTLSPTIEEPDGNVITKGLQFTVASVPESGINNSEDLIFTYGNHGEGEKPGTGSITPYGEISEMTPGMEYTLSCWARVTSGTKMRLKLFWDAAKMGTYWHDEIIDITNTEWKRVYWTFTFNPTGDQWYEFQSEKTVDGQTVACTRIGANWTKTVGFGVCRAYAGTVQLAGFRLTAGGLYGNNTVDTLRLQLAALENRVAALEAMTLENANS